MTAPTRTRGAFHKLAHRLHLCLGVSVGFYVLLMSLTGTSLLFSDELLSLIEPKVSPEAAIMPVTCDSVVESVGKKYDDHTVTWLHRQSSRDSPLEIYLTKGNDRKVELVDLYSGKLLGERNPIVQFFMNLHFDLLNGEAGRTANGVGAACLLVILLTGIIIWWQGVKRIGSRLSVDFKANWKRVNWDLHTAISIWATPFVLVWATSGFYFGFPDTFKKIFSVVLPFSEPRVMERKSGEAAEKLSVDELIRIAEQKSGGSEVRWIKIADLTAGKAVRILLSPRGVNAKDQMTEMYLYSDTGEMRSVVTPAERSAGYNFIEFLKKMHFGTIFGTYSKFVWLVIGIIPGTLFVTGFLIWLNKRV